MIDRKELKACKTISCSEQRTSRWSERDRVSHSARKHQRPYDGEREHSHSKSERDDTHPALLELSRRTGEEKNGGKQNGVCQVLTGNVAGLSRFLLTGRSFCGGLGSFSHPSHLIQVRHKWMRIGIRIFERLLCHPRVVSFAQLGRKTFNVEIQQLFVACLMGSKRLHEHARLNGRLLRSLHRQQPSSAFQHIKFIH